MPELAHVQVFRRLADERAVGKRIQEVRVFDDRPLRGREVQSFKRSLVGSTVRGTRRHGKWLFLELDACLLAIHFGMTGRLVYGDADEAPSKELTMLLRHHDGSWMGYRDRRRLGRLEIVEDLDAFLAENGLGPDAVRIGARRFARRFETRRGMVKPALMDQSLVAGLGNHMVDEALFEAGIHPKTDVSSLDETDLARIHDVAQRTTKHLVSVRAKYDRLPEQMMLRHRGERGAKCPRCDVAYRRTKVGGRTTYYCPSHQRLEAKSDE